MTLDPDDYAARPADDWLAFPDRPMLILPADMARLASLIDGRLENDKTVPTEGGKKRL